MKAIAKAYLRGYLSLSTIKYISQKNNTDIHLKSIGWGRYQTCNLVCNPKYGIVVKKMMLSKELQPDNTLTFELNRNPSQDEIEKRNLEYLGWRYLRLVSRDLSGIQVSNMVGRFC